MQRMCEERLMKSIYVSEVERTKKDGMNKILSAWGLYMQDGESCA